MSRWFLFMRQAVQQLLRYPLRSFLTAVGVTIAICALVLLVAIAEGVGQEIKDEIAALGSHLLVVRPVASDFTPDPKARPIVYTLDDIPRIKKNCLTVDAVSPFKEGRVPVSYQRNAMELMVIGTNEAYSKVKNMTIKKGRFFSQVDIDLHRSVVVLNGAAVKALSENASLLEVGQDIIVKGYPLHLIGIAEDKAGEVGPGTPIAYFPITFYQKLLQTPYENMLGFYILIRKTASVQQGLVEVRTLFSAVYGKGASDSISSMTELLEMEQASHGKGLWILGGIVAIALVQGGVGIANLLLLSVRERTREIGILKTFGAKDREILLQIMLEGLGISLVGGFLGILLGIPMIYMMLSFLELPVIISKSAILFGFVFSAGVGLVGGFYPARMAANMQPIDALRYE